MSLFVLSTLSLNSQNCNELNEYKSLKRVVVNLEKSISNNDEVDVKKYVGQYNRLLDKYLKKCPNGNGDEFSDIIKRADSFSQDQAKKNENVYLWEDLSLFLYQVENFDNHINHTNAYNAQFTKERLSKLSQLNQVSPPSKCAYRDIACDSMLIMLNNLESVLDKNKPAILNKFEDIKKYYTEQKMNDLRKVINALTVLIPNTSFLASLNKKKNEIEKNKNQLIESQKAQIERVYLTTIPKSKRNNQLEELMMVQEMNSKGWEEIFSQAIITDADWQPKYNLKGELLFYSIEALLKAQFKEEIFYQYFTFKKTGSKIMYHAMGQRYHLK